MTISELAMVVGVITTLANSSMIIWQMWKKTPKEVKKLDAEGESEIVDAAHVSLEGAKLSSTMLIDRINELKQDIENEKAARRSDAEYFRRRIRDIETELSDYRNYAARLAKQAIKAGLIPEPFISTSIEPDPLLDAIDKEKNQLEKVKDARKKEIRDVKNEQ